MSDSGKRQEPRDSLFLSVEISVSGRESVTTRVRNLSPGGMMVDMDEAADGEAVVAEMRGVGRITGHVAWVAAGRVGIAFHADIDPLKARTSTGAKTQTPAYFLNAPVRRPGLQVR